MVEIHASRRLESLVVGHVIVFLIAITWGFGGNALWLRPWFVGWGAVGAALTIAGLCARGTSRRQVWWWLLPWVGLNALVIVGNLNPSLRPTAFFEIEVFRPVPTRAGPSSARPDLAWPLLALFNGIYLSAFNLALGVRRRRTLRLIAFAVVANGLALAVFGTVQHLLGAGLYFGAVQAPNPSFFATFLYHNHWGAFAVLVTALALGLVFHYERHHRGRDFWHSPAFAGLAVPGLLAITAPLSTSRSTTILMALLIIGALVHGVAIVFRTRSRRTGTTAMVGLLVGAMLIGAAAYSLAESRIQRRLHDTRAELAAWRDDGRFSRITLYRDTWRMAAEKRWFGWGLESYATVFMNYNSTPRGPIDRLPIFYEDAHSDWLQAVAELGFVGTGLLAGMGLLPLVATCRRRRYRAFNVYPLAGCALITAYAALEFPLANPAVVLTFWILLFLGARHLMLPGRTSAASAPSHDD